jgi:DNA polymerase-4
MTEPLLCAGERSPAPADGDGTGGPGDLDGSGARVRAGGAARSRSASAPSRGTAGALPLARVAPEAVPKRGSGHMCGPGRESLCAGHPGLEAYVLCVRFLPGGTRGPLGEERYRTLLGRLVEFGPIVEALPPDAALVDVRGALRCFGRDAPGIAALVRVRALARSGGDRLVGVAADRIRQVRGFPHAWDSEPACHWPARERQPLGLMGADSGGLALRERNEW